MPISMGAIHLRQLRQADNSREILPGLGHDFVTLLDESSDLIRVIKVADRGCGIRDQWLDQILPERDEIILRTGEARYLTQATQRFEILIVSAEDKARIVPVIRDVRRVLPDKLVVPLLTSCLPEDRASLLKRGADDVLQATMPADEARARLCALMRRRTWSVRLQAGLDRQLALASAAEAQLSWLYTGHLSRQERQVLGALHARFGKVVPYGTLTVAAQTTVNLPSKEHLKAIIFRIRQRLKMSFVIFTVRGEGMVLRKLQNIND